MKRMYRWVGGLVLCGVMAGHGQAAADEELYYVHIVYQVQPDSTQPHWIDVDEGSLRLRTGMSGSAFVADAGITVVVATAGTRQLLVDFTLTTLLPSATVMSRQILIDKGQPLHVERLRYEVYYNARIEITFHPYRGELDCDFGSAEGARTVDEFVSDIPLHGAPSMMEDSLYDTDDQIWYVDPTPHFELYFIPNTLGDFSWNAIRDYLEKEFQVYENKFSLSRSQRVHYFISPCKVPEIGWIPHRTWAIEPTTFKAYSVFNRDHKEISGIPTNLNHFYRYLGYAPLVVAEGAARGFEYDHYRAKKLKWQGKLPRPSDWWPNIKYKSYPNGDLAVASGSFINYLISVHGMSSFFALYTVANDLNADSAFHTVFGTGIREQENNWLRYIDTVRIHPGLAQYFISRAQALGRNEESKELLKLVIDIDTSDVSSYQDDLSLLYFMEGQYDDAVEIIQKMPPRYREAERVNQLGSVALFFGGHVDTARQAFHEILKRPKLGPAFQSAACLILGWLEMTEGDFETADSLWNLPDPNTPGTMLDQIEMALHRARHYHAVGDREVADSLYRFALDQVLGALQRRPGGGDLYLRAGEAYIGLGFPDTAMVYLDVAEFLEYRPYYTGRVLTALGNVHDMLNMRDMAVRYYLEVLNSPSSYPARKEAEEFLRVPYGGKRASS